jgi:hypothetical protein
MKNKFIIAGIPRSGTTYLTRVIQGLPLGGCCPRTERCIGIRDICEKALTNDFMFYKTHDFAPKKLGPNIKCIFLFSNPIDSIISTINNRFADSHFLNCHCDKDLIKCKQVDLFNRDDLNYEKMFLTWTKPNKGYPVLVLRYEKMKKHHSDIEKFLGFSFEMHKFQVRKSYKVDEKIRTKLNQTYQSLIKMVKEYPDIKVLS